ncbi:MAG: glycosyltransferase [Candidatus Omnitrophica bacterium]|nr:glycosyltransferase [Candidatus Omnitrophota bacterium]
MADINMGFRKLSIFLPVYNEAESLKVMIKILEATVEVPHEILVIYDFPEDNSVEAAKALQQKFPNIRLAFNDLGRGVSNAVKKGIDICEGDIILIALVDEIFPIAAIADMLELITVKGCDFVSCSRYALGGRRLGGSLIGGVLSRTANTAFRLISGCALTDATTGIKMARRSIFEKINIEADVGWAFAFELSIKAQLLGLRMGEVPVVSVDRLFGGDSTFRVGPWMREYLRWFFWGVNSLATVGAKQTKAITLDKYSARKR